MSNSTTKEGRGVVALLRPGAGGPIAMHADWVQDAPQGFMGVDATTEGRLVRLLDVVAWLMEARGLPSLPACRLLCDDLDSEVFASLYKVRPADFAEPLGPYCTFPGPVYFVDLNRVSPPRSFWDKPEDPDSEPKLPVGLEGLKLALQSDCGSHADDPPRTDDVAILATVAHALWMYGRPTPAVPVECEQPAGAVDEWTGERLAKRRAELEADGLGKPMKRLEQESGIKERKIRHMIEAWRVGGAIGAVAAHLKKSSG